MFWLVISGIAVAAGNWGRNGISRSRFGSITLLIAAILVLLGIWVCRMPGSGGGNRVFPIKCTIDNSRILPFRDRGYHWKPAPGKRAD